MSKGDQLLRIIISGDLRDAAQGGETGQTRNILRTFDGIIQVFDQQRAGGRQQGADGSSNQHVHAHIRAERRIRDGGLLDQAEGIDLAALQGSQQV